jgi:hypothetical protein
VSLLALTTVVARDKPIWAKAGTFLSPRCESPSGERQTFKSPDGKIVAELRCRNHQDDDDPLLYLRVRFPSGRISDVTLQRKVLHGLSRRPQELLWAPDSKAFLVNGSENSYSGFFVDVYRVQGETITSVKVTAHAQRDMVRSFPPCRAAKLDSDLCRAIRKSPQYNMSGVSWTDRSSAVIVMSEVPCSSSYGGIMCQVLGYKLDAKNGAILQRMTATELKTKWQEHMAFEMKVPEPPEYESPKWEYILRPRVKRLWNNSAHPILEFSCCYAPDICLCAVYSAMNIEKARTLTVKLVVDKSHNHQ